jgi:hypothetical protein
MTRLKKSLCGFVAAAVAVMMTGMSVFADDFEFDMSKAKATQSGGKAYTEYTRLDNEPKHADNFDPLWLTEDSVYEVEYTSSGEYEDCPMYLIFQSWKGDKVSSQEDRWVRIAPTTFDSSHASWTFDTIAEAWGSSDFSEVYAFLIEDNNIHLTLSSFTVSNIEVPDDITSVADGEIIKTEASETEAIEEDDSEATVQDEDSKTEKKSKNKDKDSEEETQVENEAVPGQSTMVKAIVIVSIVGVAALVGVVVFVIIRRKRNGWY